MQRRATLHFYGPSWVLASCCKRALPVAILALCTVGSTHAACPAADEIRASVRALGSGTEPATAPNAGSEPERQTLALALLDCLADPDPALRDELAFGTLSRWMRGRQLSVATLQTMRTRLLAVLDASPDAAGFHQPFAALSLAEVARVDRLDPYLSSEDWSTLVDQSARYLRGVRDYRGFDAVQGWRHGVAHGADLMLQLSLNPRLRRAEADTMLAAIAAQVMPPGEHAYRYAESERLMAPVFYLARRDWIDAAAWQAWFEALLARFEQPAAPTQASLAQRHNLSLFLSALYVAVQENAEPAAQQRVLPELRKALKAVQ